MFVERARACVCMCACVCVLDVRCPTELYVSPNANPANATLAARVASWNTFTQPFDEMSQFSRNFTLVAGNKYFLRIQHTNYGGPGYVRVGVQVYNTSATGTGCDGCGVYRSFCRG